MQDDLFLMGIPQPWRAAAFAKQRPTCANVGMRGSWLSAGRTADRAVAGLRTEHPGFTEPGPNQGTIDKIMKALASVVDALNPLRNHSSVAHANNEILRDPEAMLVVNSVRTLLPYLNARTKF